MEQAPGPTQFIVCRFESGKTMHWIPWPDRATGFALQVEKFTGCGLYSRPTVSRAVGWVMKLPACSVTFHGWRDEGCIQQWVGLQISPCLGGARELTPRSKRLFVVLTLSWPMSQVSWTKVPLTLLCGWSALPAVTSAQAFLDYEASRYSDQPFCSGRAGSYTQHWADYDSAPLTGWEQTRLQCWKGSSSGDPSQANLHPANFSG